MALEFQNFPTTPCTDHEVTYTSHQLHTS